MADPKKILVIDDEADTVTYLTTLLNDNGYSTVSAKDGKEGMNKAKSENPDLIILDVTMPERSGTGFYGDLKSDSSLKTTPVIFVTGVTGFGGDKEGVKKFIEKRPNLPSPEGFFSKPIDREEFLKKVQQILA
jgi:CheY-like chemotaxis protein